ncbi:MAG TPA: phytanoyl-CoA dioxygenase family protein [Burkholderiales bacterium]|nr:phytanoyl-CoA dioxygenase family protein [Burkholderiales bacterium]
MLRQDVLKHPARVLTESQRERYFADGFLVLPGHVPAAWVARLKGALDDLMERSRSVTRSDEVWVLEEGHSANTPRLHRVTSPQDQHAVFWEFFCDAVMTDLAADIVGPDVKFHHAKLNVKSERGTRGFKWHQDIPAWPHTDYSPVSIGVYIDGCTPEQGPLSFARGSHEGPLFSQYDRDGNFVVRIQDEDLTWLKDEMIEQAVGGPGTVVLLHCCTVHGSLENRSDRARPLLLPVYSSADSFAYTPSPITSPHLGDIVRGSPARRASFDARPCELPPDFRGGYNPPWKAQREEEQRSRVPAM